MEEMKKVSYLLKNVNYLDVKNERFKKGNIAINEGKIVGIDDNNKYVGETEKDCSGLFLVPGFIDGHIHLESSVISPENFAKLASIHGTTAVVTDPHEIANVCGIDGIKWMLERTSDLPIDVFFMVPSCVPATEFDESAYTLNSEDVKKCFSLDNKGRILGLAEMMNYPGVIFNNQEVIKKIELTKELNKRIDGHAPGLSGEDLVKYISAGIESDHECTTLNEAIEKLEVAKSLGQDFYIMIREGTAAKNLEALHQLMNMNKYKSNVIFATDDKHPEELYSEGHIDSIIRKAISLGIKPETVYITASYNASKYFGLDNMGSIEVGKNANLVLLSDINKCNILEVYKNGEIITLEKLENWNTNKVDIKLDNKVRNSINMKEVTSKDLNCAGKKLPIIGLVEGQIITENRGTANDYDLDNDITKIVVIEPHKGTMHTGIAYMKGLGLQEGAIGTTVAHDSHYAIIAGTNDEDIALAANKIREMKGGKVIVKDNKVIEYLQLPIANLMTDEDPIKVIEKMKIMKEKINITNKNIDPFMNLSFVSLPVIGNIRLLPSGVFDVEHWKFI